MKKEKIERVDSAKQTKRREQPAFEHFDPLTGNIESPTEAAKEQDVAEKAAVAGLAIKRSG
jgi:hypothetical protein